MARIKIKDLSNDMKISKDIMKKIHGGPNRQAHDHIGRIESPSFLNRKKAGGGEMWLVLLMFPAKTIAIDAIEKRKKACQHNSFGTRFGIFLSMRDTP